MQRKCKKLDSMVVQQRELSNSQLGNEELENSRKDNDTRLQHQTMTPMKLEPFDE